MQAEALKTIALGRRQASPKTPARCIMASARPRPIHGQATAEEAKALREEGIDVAPLPFPVAPPGEAN